MDTIDNVKNNSGSFFSSALFDKQMVLCVSGIKFYDSFDMIFHSHGKIEIVYVIMGETEVFFTDGNGAEQKHILHSNEYILIDSNVPHKIRVDDIPTKFLNLEFSLDGGTDERLLLAAYKREKNMLSLLSAGSRVIKFVDDGTVIQMIILIQTCALARNDTESNSFLNYLTTALILLMAENYKKRTNKMFGIKYLNKAIDYISNYYDQEISVTEIADYCGISQNYLNMLFKKKFGTTIVKYLNNLRIEKATLLLTYTDLCVDDIRKQLGYNNKMNFNRNFIGITGMSPREYRKNKNKRTEINVYKMFSKNQYSI